MKKNLLGFILISFCLCLSGCSDRSDEIIGSWKSIEEHSTGTHDKLRTYIIEDGSIAYAGRDFIPVVWEEKNEQLLGHKRNLEGSIEWKVKIISPNRISLRREGIHDFEEFVRTTPDDVDAINKSPGRPHIYKAWTAF